ncbi:hypothetical protein KM043_012013 [Ampulex compressa]|nr:hypothetical protein KM043_012013 [Ampulex compressa]
MSPLALLAGIITIAAAMPLQDTLDDRTSPRGDAPPPSSTESIGPKINDTKQPSRKPPPKKEPRHSLLALLNQEPGLVNPAKRQIETRDKPAKKSRKHKAIFVDYPFIPRFSFPYEPDYDSPAAAEERTEAKNYQESNIFYIRLPPTPYMFVPGLGYISQPPTYSTAGLRPQLRPFRPLYQPVSNNKLRPVNPFIQLPIDFVSNGKPTSVYQWQRKPAKKPDSPITNLDGLSTEFVSNGKPTSVYQWHANLKPIARPEELVNSLDKGPYVFNGKPASLFLLRPDGTSQGHRKIRYPDYREDNAYY